MKKVCFFISSVNLSGGTERVCTEVANKLASLGWHVSILSIYGETPFFPLRPEVHVRCVYSAKMASKSPISTIFKARKLLKLLKPEVLISVDSAMFAYAIIGGCYLNLEHMVWEHFNFSVSLNSTVRIIARQLAARYSHTIITLTEVDRREWEANLKCKSRVITIPNPSPFKSQGDLFGYREQIVLAVGRLTYQKGFDRLLDVWLLVTSLIGNDWKLYIVGSGEDEEMLKNKITRLNLSHTVKLIPRTAHIEMHYRKAKIFCLPSRFEGFPMVLLEAQSYGLPLVSYNCKTGPAEILDNGNGILVEDNNQHLMANALLSLMNDESLRIEMANNSLTNSTKYDIDVIIKHWTALLT
jgi:glycosyltransferase involved in cell wall biosynthesis